MVVCKVCEKYTGESIDHSTSVGGWDDCFAKGVMCRRCNHIGHLTSSCSEKSALWERPTTLEECIPAHIRQKLNIQTHTLIDYAEPHSEREINDMNTIVIPDPFVKGGYEELKTFLDRHKIPVEKKTKESREKCLEAAMNWGAQRGLRIVKVNEITHVA